MQRISKSEISASPNRIRTDTRLVNNGDRKWAFWVILEKQPDRAAQVQLTYSSTSFAVDTYVDAGSRKVAFPHRGAMETGRRGRHWLRRRFSVHPNCPFDSAARHGREFSVSGFRFFRLQGVGLTFQSLHQVALSPGASPRAAGSFLKIAPP